MALFDKINLDKISELARSVSDQTAELARTVGDKTTDMLKIGKLNAQISSANTSIEELKTRLGDHYWKLFSEGAQLDDDAVVLCSTIKEYCEEIDSLKAQIAELKAEKAPAVTICPACGAENAEDALFCKKCGAKLTAEAAEEPEETQVECVTDAPEEEEAPQTKTCPTCGAENGADNNFCEKCGSKL